MSGYPIVLEGEEIEAVVVGGGRIAERKARSLLAAGARVRMVAPEFSVGAWALGLSEQGCNLIQRPYESDDLAGATLVVAATNQPDVNARVAVDARARGQLVNVVDEPLVGNFVTPATHRSGDLVVAVTAGGVPSASTRVRDAIAERFDDRYAEAVRALAALRRRLLDAGDREGWHRALGSLVSDGFCARVEAGGFVEEVAAWR